jgi:hypothetical protein
MRRILISGVTAAAILGTGAGALAVSGTDQTSGTPAKTSHAAGKHAIAKALRRHAVHGQIVTKGKDGYVRHDGVTGVVTAVSASAIGVKAADGYTETFTVTSDTKVRRRSDGKGAPSTLSAVKTGDTVAVFGRAESEHARATARLVLDGVKR